MMIGIEDSLNINEIGSRVQRERAHNANIKLSVGYFWDRPHISKCLVHGGVLRALEGAQPG